MVEQFKQWGLPVIASPLMGFHPLGLVAGPHPGAMLRGQGEAANSAKPALNIPAPAAGGPHHQLTFAYRGLPVDSFSYHLTGGGTTPISGGTMDVTTTGTLSATDSNLPLSVTFNNTNVSIGGTATPVASLTIPVAVRGPMDNPVIRVDSSALQNALLDAGKKEAVNRLQGEASKQLGIEAGEDGDSLEDTAKNVLGGLMKRQK